MRTLEDTSLLLLIIAVSFVFGWILLPFYGALLWGTVIAIVFAPLYDDLLKKMPHWPNSAALLCVTLIVVIVILPMALVALSLVQEASGVYARIKSGDLDLVTSFVQVRDTLPAWASKLMGKFGLTSLGAIETKLSALLMKSTTLFAAGAFNAGQMTFDFIMNMGVMLYLVFFLLRDGHGIANRIEAAIPLVAKHKAALFLKFSIVIRATMKGDMLVALLQGALGGVIFSFLGISAPLLWAVLMAFLSLLPAIGAALVWCPVAIYFLAIGSTWQGVVLILFGALVIGLVDNVLRPILVGKDTKMPNYVVLISTLGGIATFGLNGFVIGPMIAAMFISAWDIFYESRHSDMKRDLEPNTQ